MTVKKTAIPTTSSNIRQDGASSLNSIINIDENNDNTFKINLTPVSVNVNNSDFNDQMELFDDEISQLIIQNDKEMKEQEQLLFEDRILPSMDPPVKPFTFTTPGYYCPISFDESLIKMG